MDPLHLNDPDSPPRAPSLEDERTAPGSAAGAMEHPLRPIVNKWIEKIKKGIDFKRVQFSDDAKECMRFFNGPYQFMYAKDYASKNAHFKMQDDEEGSDLPAPTFQMTFNKAAEVVQLFGPSLYHKNPYRQANPRKIPELPFGIASAIAAQQPQQPVPGQMPIDPMMVQQWEQSLAQSDQLERSKDLARAGLMEWYLNYTPNELNLKYEARATIDETLIKGMGVMWTEVYQPKGANLKLIGSFYDTIDFLVLDPDAEQRQHCMWAVRKCVHPYWKVEQDYGLPAGSLKRYCTTESYDQQANVAVSPDGDYERKRGETNDLLTYWKLYSKMGIGGRLKDISDKVRETLDQFGDYCFLALVEGCPYPLNVPPDVINVAGGTEEILKRLEWPTPFWMDDAWPFTIFELHPVPRQLYAMSHLKPAMGLLMFLNWAYSFIASKIRVSSRDFLAIRESVGTEIIDTILHGSDYSLLKLKTTHPEAINEIVQFLQHPNFNGDIWTVIQAVTDNFEKATGLSELMYGQSATQMRSAEEAQVKAGQISIRPDDMANRIEDAMADVAKNEAIAIRWHIGPQDVLPLAGQAFAFYWGQLVTATDPYAMAHQLEYGIEAGSSRKPNKDRDQTNINQAVQTFFTPMMQYFQATGNPQQVNALITDWAKAHDVDASRYQFPAMPPPPPPGAEGEQTGGEAKPKAA